MAEPGYCQRPFHSGPYLERRAGLATLTPRRPLLEACDESAPPEGRLIDNWVFA